MNQIATSARDSAQNMHFSGIKTSLKRLAEFSILSKFKSIEISDGLGNTMRLQPILGIILIIIGLALLYLLRDVLVRLILFVLGFLGIVLALILIVIGLGLIFFRRRSWRFSI